MIIIPRVSTFLLDGFAFCSRSFRMEFQNQLSLVIEFFVNTFGTGTRPVPRLVLGDRTERPRCRPLSWEEQHRASPTKKIAIDGNLSVRHELLAKFASSPIHRGPG